MRRLLAALLVLSLAACGEDDADPTSDDQNTPATQQGSGDGATDDNMEPAPGTDDAGGGTDRPTTSTPAGQSP